MRRTLLAALTVLALPASAARADSDGYYCVGSGYLAVEFRPSDRPGPGAAHVIKIARFDAVGGPRWAGEVVLEDFQVHGLTCGPDQVTVEGYAGRIGYVVALDTARVPSIRARLTQRDRRVIPLSPPLQNLGLLARAGVTLLPTAGSNGVFRLRITRTSQSTTAGSGGLDHRITSELEELNGAGNVSRSLVLFQGGYFEPIH